MNYRFYFANYMVKVTQGIIAYANIVIQTHALNDKNFNTLSVIGNAVLLSAFLDLGVGVQFVQGFLKISAKNGLENEDFEALSYVKSQYQIFLIISLVQSVLITFYSIIYFEKNSRPDLIPSIIVTFLITFIFNFFGLITKILIARGYVFQSVLFQMLGVLGQALVSLIGLIYTLDLKVFLLTLALPNVLTAILSYRFIKSKIKVQVDVKATYSNSIHLLNFRIQILQFLQFVIGTLPILLISRHATAVVLSATLIQWRIFNSVCAALSSINLSEWRNNSLPKDLRSHAELIHISRKLLFSIILALIVALTSVASWNLLAGKIPNPGFTSWILWCLYAPIQIYQWNYYFLLLPKGLYGKLIEATLIQLIFTVMLVVYFEPSDSRVLPASVIVGLVMSSFYMRKSFNISNKIEFRNDLNDEN